MMAEHDTATLRGLVGLELDRHDASAAIGDTGAASWALERAHILSQPDLPMHLRVHWAMLGYAVRQRDLHEVAGQTLRLALAPIGSLTGRIPRRQHGALQRQRLQAHADPGRPARRDRCGTEALTVPSLTRRSEGAMRSLVSRMLRFLIGLALLASMGLGVAAHANEQICIPGAEASAIAGHADGDADQVPSDSEKGYPHHHGGCHGHHVAAPIDTGSATGPVPATSDPLAAGSTLVALAPPGATLRPPIA